MKDRIIAYKLNRNTDITRKRHLSLNDLLREHFCEDVEDIKIMKIRINYDKNDKNNIIT